MFISQNYGHYSSLVFSLIEIHFINIMFWLKKYFSTINSMICDVMNDFHSLEAIVHFKKVSELNLLSKIVSSTKKKLKYLKELHSDMCNIAEFANSTYNVKMLLIVADKFRISITGTYFTVVTILNYDRGLYAGNIWNFLTVLMCLGIFQFILILWYASFTANEVSVHFTCDNFNLIKQK